MAEQTATSEAADLATDPGTQRVAGVYAKAFLAAAQAGQSGAQAAEAAVTELSAVAADVCDRHPRFAAVLASGLIPAEEKVQIIERTFSGKVAPIVFDFLRVLARHDRLGSLRDIARAAREEYDQLLGRVRVEVSTATELTSELAAKIKDQLRDMLGGEPVLVPKLNPELIGGVVLRVGDAVYDGSVAAQLNTLRGRIINRSVHEIQSRRDRFSHPAGN